MSNTEGRKLRLCTRCPNVATEQRGSNKTGKLCIACNKARRERQANSHMQPNCKGCGSKAHMGSAYCRRCEDERLELEQVERSLDLDEYVVDTLQKLIRNSAAELRLVGGERPRAISRKLEQVADQMEVLK